MYGKIIFLLIMLQGIYVKGIDLNSMFGRFYCFNNVEKNCSKTFIEAYPELSKSVTYMKDADTFMLLYTRKSSDPENLHLCGGKLPPDTNFNPQNEVFVIFIPFQISFCNSAIHREWVVQLLMRGDYNIIVIDYSWGNQLDYVNTVQNLRRIVKNQTVILLKNIQNKFMDSFVHLTFIGLGLGAQLAGMVGAMFTVDRIIALDPAGPAFAENETDLNDRLDPSDAKLVEVWHTNANSCLPDLGINYEAGHVNFYINGGTYQASCFKYGFTSLLKGDFLYGLLTLLIPTKCSHAQSTQYFKVSINPGNCQFIGVRCTRQADCKLGKHARSCGDGGENCLIMGLDTEKYIKRIPTEPEMYYVETSNECPYCDNKHIELSGYKDTYQSSLQHG